jgi:hypothetical protein
MRYYGIHTMGESKTLLLSLYYTYEHGLVLKAFMQNLIYMPEAVVAYSHKNYQTTNVSLVENFKIE